MHNKYIFSNIIGTFVFNEHFNIIKSKLFTNKEQYNNKEKFEKEFLKKYSDLKKPEGKELKRILNSFKSNEFHKEFRKKNIELSKKLVKESVNDDNFVIQTVSNIEELDKVINMLVKRLREWFSLNNPELSHEIFDNEEFINQINKKTKKKDSMGADLKKSDLEPILKLTKQVQELFELRKKQNEYLEKLMKSNYPNLQAVAGTNIAAKMLARAGSLRRLMEFPSSTIQLLGAEKSFFRHLKTQSRSPKYGYLLQHPIIAQAKKSIHGKIARAIASKISIAVKVDYFKGKFVGDKLRKGLEEKFQ